MNSTGTTYFSRWYVVRPTKREANLIDLHRKICTKCWNETIRKIDENNKLGLPFKDDHNLRKELTEELHRLKEINDISEDSYIRIGRSFLTCTISSVVEAYKSFFIHVRNGDKKSRPPRERNNICKTITVEKGWRIENGYFILNNPGKGRKSKHEKPLLDLKLQNYDNIENETACIAKIKFDGKRYFIGIMYKLELPKLNNIIENPIAFDWGVKNLVTDQNGSNFNFPDFLSRNEWKRLKNIQRGLKLKVSGSNNYKRTRDKIQNIWRKFNNRKKAAIVNFAHFVVDNHDAVFTEDLDFYKMQSDLKHGKAVLHNSPSELFDWFRWLCLKQGKHFFAVNPAYTSMTCSDCGYVKKDLTQKDREWTCPNCGCYHDRDQNAAINILNLGVKHLSSTIWGVQVKQTEVYSVMPLLKSISNY